MNAQVREENHMSSGRSEFVHPARKVWRFTGTLLSLGALVAFAAMSTGCATKGKVQDEQVVENPPAPPPADEPMERTLEEAPPAPAEATREPERGPLEFPVVRFEFDSDLITADGREALDAFAAEWRARGVARGLTIEGHADERGPEEYNLLLGQKRANSVRRYLSRLGVPDDALKTVSYGENRPLDVARTEEAHARNRRAEVREH